MRLLPAIAVVAALAAAVLSACGDSTNLEVSPPSVVEPTPSSITLELAGRHTTGVYNAGGNLTCGAGNAFCGNQSLNCQVPPGTDAWQSCSGCVLGSGAC